MLEYKDIAVLNLLIKYGGNVFACEGTKSEVDDIRSCADININQVYMDLDYKLVKFIVDNAY
jgi:hypothetical protein